MGGSSNSHSPRPNAGLRLCRFQLSDEDTPLIGFYDEDWIVPVDQAAEAYSACCEDGRSLGLTAVENILDLLPPDGPGSVAACELADWLNGPEAPPKVDIGLLTAEVHLLPPIDRPGKILALAGNYAEHIREHGGLAVERRKTFPYVFIKPPNTLNRPGGPIALPRISPNHIDWECELGVVIGRTCRHVSESDALSYVAGYTVINDISDRRFRPNPERAEREKDKFFDWLHGKWHDGFCPVGPCLLSARSVSDPQALPIRLLVNGKVRQDASTSRMIFPVAAVVSFISHLMTLEPGDLIATGTPSGVGNASGCYLRPGDLVCAEIEPIGRLENPVTLESDPDD